MTFGVLFPSLSASTLLRRLKFPKVKGKKCGWGMSMPKCTHERNLKLSAYWRKRGVTEVAVQLAVSENSEVLEGLSMVQRKIPSLAIGQSGFTKYLSSTHREVSQEW